MYDITDWPVNEVDENGATTLHTSHPGYGYVSVDRPMPGNTGHVDISLPAEGAPVFTQPVDGAGYADDDPAAELATLLRAQEYLRAAIERYQ